MQIAYSFDRETVRRIIKGIFHSILSTSLLVVLNGLLAIAGQVHITDPTIAAIFMIVCQNLYNSAKEYISGI